MIEALRGLSKSINDYVLYTKPLLNIKEVARILGTSVQRVYRYLDTGLLEYATIGNMKITRETIDNFIKEWGTRDVDATLTYRENQSDYQESTTNKNETA